MSLVDDNNLETSKSQSASVEKRGRPRWPLLAALVVFGVLYGFLPDDLRIGPSLLIWPVMILLVIAFYFTHRRGMHQINHYLALGAAAVVTLLLISSVILLITLLITKREKAVTLLGNAAIIWVTNVIVFATWYWLVDGGGPQMRHSDHHETSDFLFPQMVAGGPGGANWMPDFIDYLFLAFNTSTAFSPTDTAVLSRRCKLLMMVQATMSLVVVGVLAARAINIL